MRAIGYLHDRESDGPECLVDLDLPQPDPLPEDLLVRVNAVSVNPIDLKVRRRQNADPGSPVVLGWDAVGTVESVGTATRGFRPGDRVWFAGDITRPGSNAELACVDHRIAAHAPRTVGDADAAALPLTSITAWEILFDRLPERLRTAPILIVGASGGVGSVLVQLATQIAGMPVIATASPGENSEWVRDLGATTVLNHREHLRPQLDRLPWAPATAVLVNRSADHFADVVDALQPQGAIALIDDPPSALDVTLGKRKSISLHWESMFTRSTFRTTDMARQGEILAEVAALVDRGVLRSTATVDLGPLGARSMRRAHELVANGGGRGKVVLAGWGG